MPRVGRADAGKQLHDRGGRVGQEPVGGSHHPGAGDDHRAVHDVDVEHLERRAGADDIDDGVEAADLVEVDLLGRPAVEASLGLGEGGEDGEGAAADAIGEPGLLDQGRDVGGRAHDRRLVGVDVGLGRADAAAEHGLRLEAPAVHGEALDHGADLVDVGARVDERAEGHVAGDAGEAVEPGEPGHGMSPEVGRSAVPRSAVAPPPRWLT